MPASIHCSPETLGGGSLARVRDGDMIRVDAAAGTFDALVEQAEWDGRLDAEAPPPPVGMGRELFALFRQAADEAESGASPLLAEANLSSKQFVNR